MKCLHCIFYADPQSADNKVQMLFRETTGREVRLHMIPQFRFHGSSGIALAPDIERLLFFYQVGQLQVPFDRVVLSISPAKGETIDQPIRCW